MSRRRKKVFIWLALLLGGVTLFQTVGFTDTNGAFQGGCVPWTSNGVASAVDMCYLLDCQNGFFGGLVNPCDPQKPALLDCPGTSTSTTTGTSTTTTGTTSGSST